MKLMRLAICVAVFAVIGGIAISEDLDVRALQAKLAAQEARLNDLQAKMNSKGGAADAEGVVSLRKNAVVTIGGTVNTRYFYRQGQTKSDLNLVTTPGANAWDPSTKTYGRWAGGRWKREEMKHGDLRISDAKLEFKIDVNDYFDAYLKLDLQDVGRGNVSGVAQNYWVRWKNVCNSGFGLLVGRDALKFGDSQPIGILDSWNKDQGGSWNDVMGNSGFMNWDGTRGQGMFAGNNSALPAHTTWNWTRTTQITPYWESQDGKFKAEVSFIQSIDRINGMTGVQNNGAPVNSGINTRKYRSINYGVGSMTARLTWKPIDGLKLTASALNYYANNYNGMTWAYDGRRDNSSGYAVEMKRNNTAVNFGFQYRPCFFNRLNVWAQWTHGWNEAWVDDQDSDSVNFGVMFDLTEKLTFFAMGDYLRTKNRQGVVWHKANGWAAYTGLKYKLGYGVALEAGWRHEQIKYKGLGGTAFQGTHTKQKADTIYGHLGFDF